MRLAARGWLAAVAALAVAAGFMALGVWQIRRSAWKRALLAAVAGAHLTPVAAPPPPSWPDLSGTAIQYRHVTVSGQYLPIPGTCVKAVTNLGPGFWVMSPLASWDGQIVLINRGFVPDDACHDGFSRAEPPAGHSTVTGLVRLSEPGGGFLRHNQPAANRWYSRDVAAIAETRNFVTVAPYFIDADSGLEPALAPVGGLTVLEFPNNHLIYALTWFALAALATTLAVRLAVAPPPADEGNAVRDDPITTGPHR